MQILWIRHGKTLGNVQRRYVGRTDEGLTDEAKLCLQKKQVLKQGSVRAKQKAAGIRENGIMPGHLYRIMYTAVR